MEEKVHGEKREIKKKKIISGGGVCIYIYIYRERERERENIMILVLASLYETWEMVEKVDYKTFFF